ncbi:MAG: GspE/PulE family protein [Patescibacteria group bacterium]|mgnify:CR=1 FL=1
MKFNEEKQKQRLTELKKVEAENLTEILAKRHGVPYKDLSMGGINMAALLEVSEKDAREAELAPFNIINKKIHLGLLSPENLKSLEVVEDLKRKGFEPIIFMVSRESLERIWERYKDLSGNKEIHAGSLEISSAEIVEFLKEASDLEKIKKLIEEDLTSKKAYRITRILEIMLAGALSTKSSDIHMEPEEKNVRLRFRMDGVLVDVLDIDLSTYKLILSRIKLLSNLKLNVTSKGQDGRFSIKLGEEEIEIRTSILPVAESETIVLRILNPKSIGVPLEDLGINPRLLKILLREAGKPNGMILTTGPTGSGKTTTLYAFLKKIYSPEIKIITIENPVEYHLSGIVQTQTNEEKGYTFLEGLRSALRQDPDVIMVGEIRDRDTAEIAINAALTGHLVFTTLHTNTAAGSFPRLIDLGVNPKVLTSAINIAIAQRLVRKLCESCKKKIPLTPEKKDLVKKTLEAIQDKSYLENIQTEFNFEPVGCSECHSSGFRGRIGIYEAILTNQKIEEIVEQNPSEREINKAALDQNILNMKQDGILKVLQGITSISELERVIDLLE